MFNLVLDHWMESFGQVYNINPVCVYARIHIYIYGNTSSEQQNLYII